MVAPERPVPPRDRILSHGHVIPNPDGTRARCGGPTLCAICALELANLQAKELKEAERFRAIADRLMAYGVPSVDAQWQAQHAVEALKEKGL